jgi:hypothetical protein
MRQQSAPVRPRTHTALPMIWWDRFRLRFYASSDREGVGQTLHDREDIQALCDRRDQLEEQLRTTAYQAKGLELQIRFWRWAAYEMAELARQAVAKYGNAKFPPASPLLDTRGIMEMYERAGQAFVPLPRLPGESMLAYQNRLLAHISPATKMEALEMATGAARWLRSPTLSAAAASLPSTTDE